MYYTPRYPCPKQTITMSEAVTLRTVASTSNGGSPTKVETEEEQNKNTMCWNYHFTRTQTWTEQSRPVNKQTNLHWYFSPLLELEALSSCPPVPCMGPRVMLAQPHGPECWEFQQKIAMWNINCEAVRHNKHWGGVNVRRANHVSKGEFLGP